MCIEGGYTPFGLAISLLVYGNDISKTEFEEVIKFFKKNGFDMNAKVPSTKGGTHLHSAVGNLSSINDSSKIETVIELLVNNGCDINAQNDDGNTPIMSNIKFINLATINQLIKSGIDLNKRNKEGNTAVDILANEPCCSSVNGIENESLIAILPKTDLTQKHPKKGLLPFLVAVREKKNTDGMSKIIEETCRQLKSKGLSKNDALDILFEEYKKTSSTAVADYMLGTATKGDKENIIGSVITVSGSCFNSVRDAMFKTIEDLWP